MRFESIPHFIDARQFKIEEATSVWADIVIPWSSGKQPRDASYGYLDTGKRRLHVCDKDWLVSSVDGNLHYDVLRPFEMTARYKPVGEPPDGEQEKP